VKFLLTHQYAGNKGDRAVAFAICTLIRISCPDAEIILSTSHPELWQDVNWIDEYRVALIPHSWDYERVASLKGYWRMLRKIQKYTFTIAREAYLRGISSVTNPFIVNPQFRHAVKKADVIISVGGHHFTTILSTDLVCDVSYDAMAVLSSGKPLYCFSQSFGPFIFRNKRNQLLTQKILTKSKCYVREEKSVEYLSKLGIEKSNIFETYESVISLASSYTGYTEPSNRENTVGIAIYATQYRKPEVLSEYITSISDTCNHLINKGYHISFFPMEILGTPPDDRKLIHEIIDKIDLKENVTVMPEMPTLQHLHEVGKCKFFIGHKTHSTIFALTVGTPLIGIAYHPKTREFMRQYNLDRFCIDEEKLDSDKLIICCNEIEPILNDMGQSEFSKSKVIAKKIISDFNKIINS